MSERRKARGRHPSARRDYSMSLDADIVLSYHPAAACVGPCPFHMPSDHAMVEWPIRIAVDAPNEVVQRVCSHGMGHPDPDSVHFLQAMLPLRELDESAWAHPCDGCCSH